MLSELWKSNKQCGTISFKTYDLYKIIPFCYSKLKANTHKLNPISIHPFGLFCCFLIGGHDQGSREYYHSVIPMLLKIPDRRSRVLEISENRWKKIIAVLWFMERTEMFHLVKKTRFLYKRFISFLKAKYNSSCMHRTTLLDSQNSFSKTVTEASYP